MSAESQKQTVLRMIEDGWNAGTGDIAYEICSENFVNTTSILPVPKGPAGLANHIDNARKGVVGNQILPKFLAADGDTVFMAFLTAGAYSGYQVGGTGNGARYSNWNLGFWEFEGDLLSRWDSNWEPVRLLAQTAPNDLFPPQQTVGTKRVAQCDQLDGISNLRDETYPHPDGHDLLAGLPVADDVRARIVEQVRRVLIVEFTGELDDLSDVLTADAFLSFTDDGDRRGPAGMSARAADLAKGFTARALSIEQTVIDSAEGGVRWTVELEHTGDYLGLPASGRVSRVSGSAAVRFKDGKIDYWVEVIDLMGLVRDLGGWSIPLRGCYPSQ